MTWLLLAILCYILFALNALGDKFLLSDTSLKNPRTYAVFVGFAGALVLVAIPFLGFPTPPTSLASMVLAFASGVSFIFALLPFFAGLKKFQATSIVPTVGAMQPIFALALGVLLFSGEIAFSFSLFAVLLLLIIGGVLVTAGKHGRVSIEALSLGLLAGFFFALSFVLAKQVYLTESLWYGIFWSRISGAFIALLFFTFSGKVRQEIFAKSPAQNERGDISKAMAGAVFVGAQGVGALAGIMQQAAIYMAPVSAVAIINALQGTQYVFVFILSSIAAKKFPKAFKDRYASDDTVYKVVGIFMILIGISILVFYE